MGESLLKDLFSNLLENSINHSNCNKIRISTNEKKDEYIITLKKILDRGYTTDKERGTGLGMFLVKTLLEIYGGSIEVKDSELGGARFYIHLQKA